MLIHTVTMFSFLRNCQTTVLVKLWFSPLIASLYIPSLQRVRFLFSIACCDICLRPSFSPGPSPTLSLSLSTGDLTTSQKIWEPLYVPPSGSELPHHSPPHLLVPDTSEQTSLQGTAHLLPLFQKVSPITGHFLSSAFNCCLGLSSAGYGEKPVGS